MKNTSLKNKKQLIEYIKSCVKEIIKEGDGKFYIIDFTDNNPAMAFVLNTKGDTIHTSENALLKKFKII
jgi:hypothetical protein